MFDLAMSVQEVVMSCLVGLGLAAAVGFRVFLPLLIVGILYKFQLMPEFMSLGSDFGWLTSNWVLASLTVASVVEIAGYQIPAVDNFLDFIASPLALIAGALLMTSSLGFIENPFLKFSLGVLAGAGSAGLVQASTVGLRMLSTKTTGTLGNPLYAALETVMSILTSIFAVFLPVLLFIASVLFVFIVYWIVRKFKARSSAQSS